MGQLESKDATVQGLIIAAELIALPVCWRIPAFTPCGLPLRPAPSRLAT